jgi:hypothetical protein
LCGLKRLAYISCQGVAVVELIPMAKEDLSSLIPFGIYSTIYIYKSIHLYRNSRVNLPFVKEPLDEGEILLPESHFVALDH